MLMSLCVTQFKRPYRELLSFWNGLFYVSAEMRGELHDYST